MSDKLLCACGDSLTIEAVCVNCHVAELAAKDASIETWKSRSDRCDQQAKMWEQRALEAGARAEKAEDELEGARQHVAILSTCMQETADELGCASDNEAILLAAHHLKAELAEARRELETERARLAVCGVVAMSNTPESAVAARQIQPEYRSASCDDVAQAVDREIALRAELTEARRDAEALRLDYAKLAVSHKRVALELKALAQNAERRRGTLAVLLDCIREDLQCAHWHQDIDAARKETP